jgi:hypothetical protein
MIKDNTHNTNLFKTAQSNNGDKLTLSPLTGLDTSHIIKSKIVGGKCRKLFRDGAKNRTQV